MSTITDNSLVDKYKESNKERSSSEFVNPENALKELSQKLQNSLEVVEKACVLANEYRDKTNLRGIESMRTHLSAYYVASRKLGEARSKRQIESNYNQMAFGYENVEESRYSTQEISKTAKRIMKSLNMNREFCKPSDYISFWQQVMDFSDKELLYLKRMVSQVEEMIEYNGYSPLPLSASVVWLIKGHEHGLEEIADYAVSTDTTIRKNARDIFYDVHTCDIDPDFKSENPYNKLTKEVKN